MSISDIRQYNASHAQDYELNVNDCRCALPAAAVTLHTAVQEICVS